MRILLSITIVLFAVLTSSAQTLTGVVVDQKTNAIRDAVVDLRDGTMVIARTRTDEEGGFTITVPTIELAKRLTVTAPGFARFERELGHDGVQDFMIVLAPADIASQVIVSITGTETRLDETPASVVVLDRETITTNASQTVDDTLRQVPGFSLFRRSSSKTSNPTTQGANLRGLAGSGASRTSVLLDGLSLNDAFGGWTYWSRVPRVAIDRVEVLRGGASSLYGESALSGAINIESASSGDSPIVRVEASGGSHGTADGGLLLSYSKSRWTIDLAGELFRTSGYIPAAEAERGSVDSEANSSHANGILTLGRSFGSDAAPGRVFVRANIFGERRANGTVLTLNRTYFRQLAAGTDLSSSTFGQFSVRANLEAQVYDQTFSAISNNRNTETLSRLQRVPSQSSGVSATWSRPFGEHAISSGIEAREVRGFSDEVGFANGAATSLSGSGGSEQSVAIYAQDSWQVTPRFNILLGLRFDGWRNTDAHTASRSLVTGILTESSFADRSESAVSPRAAAIVKLTTEVSLFGSYSRSFRAPTLNELYRAFRVGNVITLANENLEPERASAFEGGVSYGAADGKRWIRANVFVSDVTDPVVSVTLGTTPSLITRQRQNIGRTRAAGVEIDSEFRPHPELRISAGYLFVDSRVSDYPVDPDLVGKFVPQVANQQATFQIAYSPTRFSIAFQARVADRQFEDDVNTLRLRPYFTADGFASYRIHSTVQIFAAAENLFDTRYDIGRTPNLTVAAPRSVRAGIRLYLPHR